MRKVAGLADNWDDLQDHLIIADTPVENKVSQECFAEKNLDQIEAGKTILQSVEIKNKTFGCAGFEVVDAGGKHSGAILSAINVTPHILALKKANQEVAVLSAVLFIIVSLLSILLSRLFLEPIKRLTQAALSISGGDLSARASIKSRDEIGQLAQSFNNMTDSLLKTSADVRQKAEELEAQNEELEATSAELEEAKTGLEEKVKERTTELEQAKTGLESEVQQHTVELQKANEELNQQKAGLEQEVAKRTEDLQDKLLELERFNKIAVGRELKMVELKKEIARLKGANTDSLH